LAPGLRGLPRTRRWRHRIDRWRLGHHGYWDVDRRQYDRGVGVVLDDDGWNHGTDQRSRRVFDLE